MFINQRYGLEVNGGSEQLTREYAERLVPYYDVEVLTTCALDHFTWKDYYLEGKSTINGVTVRRFRVDRKRSLIRFSRAHARLLAERIPSVDANDSFINEQGPLCTSLIRYINDNVSTYDVFIFVTYLYYLTIRGICLVNDRSILIPTAHDESMLYLDLYKNVFSAPCAIAFLTEEEQKLVHCVFRNQNIPSEVIGAGVELPENIESTWIEKKFGISEYILYVGRIEEGKGCGQMLEYFTKYKKDNPSELKLILLGKTAMAKPSCRDIISLGFVDEDIKYNIMSGAKALIMPSKYESLSLVVLESLALGVPIIVNGRCDVLRGHCLRSNAGLYYLDYYEFRGELDYLLSHTRERALMGQNGRKYVEEQFNWSKAIEIICKMINDLFN